MNIIHLTSLQLFLGGGERLIDNWCLNSAHPSICYSAKGGIDYLKVKHSRTYGNPTELASIIQKHADSVIVTHDTEIIRNIELRNCPKLIWYVHGAFTFGLDISACARPKFVISNYSPKTLHPSWSGTPVFPVQLGIDMDQFQPPAMVVNRTKINVGIVGRISEEKVPLYFFDFIEKFNKNIPNRNRFDFHFIGKGVPESKYYREFMQRLNSIPNAIYAGEVSKDKVQNVYHSLDLLVVPSLSETGSYAIVEAQACGLRVLALNADGIPNHMTGESHLCVNYDHIFGTLSGIHVRDTVEQRAKQSTSTRERHSLGDWASKLDKLAEIANLP